MISLAPGLDLAVVIALAKKESNALGFLPRSKYSELDRLGRLAVVSDNGDPLGYVAWGAGRDGVVRVYQIATRYDARRVRFADELHQVVEAYAARVQARLISLRCASDLEANLFWAFEGFQVVRSERPDNARRREINVWEKVLRPYDVSGFAAYGDSLFLLAQSPKSLSTIPTVVKSSLDRVV